MKKIIIKQLKKLNNIALKHGDVPVSCIIVKNNKIIAKEYNKSGVALPLASLQSNKHPHLTKI